MASASTGWKVTHKTSTSSNGDTSIQITVTAVWQNDGWDYDISNVSAWVYCGSQSYQVMNNAKMTCTGTSSSKELGSHTFTITKTKSTQNISCYAKVTSNSTYVSGTKSSSSSSVSVGAKKSYTISYNANGGSGAPGSQTKWISETLVLSSTKPTRTGYTFNGWNTNSGGTGTNYSAGGNYTANAAATLYAKWTANTYTVSYDANGGSGAPSSQTKTYGSDLTLSSTKPTRTNYIFKGWATSSGGSVAYNSGGKYTANASIKLYAVWELAYVPPRINNFKAFRSTSTGVSSETGTYITVTFNWDIDSDRTIKVVQAEHKKNSDASYTPTSIATTSKAVTKTIGGGGISTETAYNVRVYVQDSNGSSYSEVINIGTVAYPIDVKAEGKGIAFGKVAETANVADFGFTPRFQSTPQHMVSGRARTPVRMIPGTTDGDGIQIGTGGLIVIGSGESATNFVNWASLSTSGNSEKTYILSDGPAYVITNLNSAYADRKEFVFNSTGNFDVPGYVYSGDSSADSVRGMYFENKFGKMSLQVSGAGNMGLYNHTKNKWMIYSNTDGNIVYGSNVTGNITFNGQDYLRGISSSKTINLIRAYDGSTCVGDDSVQSRIYGSSGKFMSTAYTKLGHYIYQMIVSNVTITPSAAGTPTGKAVTFSPAFGGNPKVALGLYSSVPGSTVTGVGHSGRSTTGTTIYVTRSNKTDTVIDYIAAY